MPDPKPTKRKRRITPDSNPETIGELFDIMIEAGNDEDGGDELECRFSCWLEALPKLREEHNKLRALASLAETFARENPDESSW